MTSFLNSEEILLSKKFESQGFVIIDIKDLNILRNLRNIFIDSINDQIKLKNKPDNHSDLFNFIHKSISSTSLNSFRLKVIEKVNKNKNLRKFYYQLAKPALDTLLGNELVMQLRINLSIQLPNDKNSLLPIHSDVWSGDSPFETVVWLPLVDCSKTKSMFILPPNKYDKMKKIFLKKKTYSSDHLFKLIKRDLIWINIKYGQLLVFNQCLPHGNTVNKEKETRWSLNCRFKSVFTPYNDKKIGEFFEPITLRKISDLGMKYKLPKIK